MTKKKLFSASRSFIRANLMLRNFNKTDSRFHITDFNHYLTDPQGIYFCLWYALLFNVLEFLDEEKLTPLQIKKEVKEVFTPLKKFRNAVLHPQASYFDKRFEFMLNENYFKKVQHIHNELSNYFDAELATYGEETRIELQSP